MLMQARTLSENPLDIAYRAEQYDLSNFALPPPPPVNAAAAGISLAEYEALKQRMFSDTLLFGAVGAAIATLGFGIEQVSC